MRNPTFPLTGTDAYRAEVAEAVLSDVRNAHAESVSFTYTKADGTSSTRTILGTDYTVAGDPGTNKRHVIATTPDGVRTFNLMGMSDLRWSLK